MNSAHMFYRAFLNPLINRLLRSPFHGIISKRVFAISYCGVKTGRRYSIPVAYFTDHDEMYCFTDGNWWKNFVAGKNVDVVLRGKTHAACAQAVAEDIDTITAVMQRVFARQPHYAHHFGVTKNADGSIDLHSARAAARGLIMVKISLLK